MIPIHMPFPDYCALAGVNWSTLGKMRASPKHYRDAVDNRRDPTAAQVTGSAVHALVLEPETFREHYAVWEGDGTRASKEYRIWESVSRGTFSEHFAVWEGAGSTSTKAAKEFAAERGGVQLITPEEFGAATSAKVTMSPVAEILNVSEYAEVVAMSDAVDTHHAAGPLFTAGWAEMSFTWTDPATGITCKGRTDWLCQDGVVSGDGGKPSRRRVILVDLKTSTTADAREFGRSAAKYGYHMQLAHYRAGLIANGYEVSQVLIVVVESSAPYDVCVYEITDDQIAKASAEVAALLARVKECEASGEWPGRCDEITPLDLPAWVMGSDDVAVSTLWGAT